MNAIDVITARMRERGTTQAFLVEKTSIPANRISLTLQKKRKLPADEFVAICVALELALDDFRKEKSA